MDAASLKTAQKVTNAAKASIAIGAGGDSKMSGLGKSSTRGAGGAMVTAKYEVDVQGGRGRATTYLVKGTKPLWILDNPTQPHYIFKGARANRAMKPAPLIKAKKGKKTLAAKQSFYESLFGGDQPQRVHKKHPGTKGKRTFWRAVDRVTPMVPKWYADALSASMAKRLLK